MSQETNARLLPQKPSKWAKILLNRKVPVLLFLFLELTFLIFSYVSLQEHFPSIILWGTLVECLYLLLFAQSIHGLPFQIILADYHCPLSNFWDSSALFFSR